MNTMNSKPSHLRRLVRSYTKTTRTLPKQAYVARPGDTPRVVLYIESGRVRQYDTRNNGTEVTLNMYGKGACVALPWMLYDIPNTYFFQTTEETVVREVPVSVAREWFENDQALSYETLQRVIRGFDGMYSRLLAHSSNDAVDRVLTELTIEARRFGVSKKQGTFITITSTELASRTGLARETASRILSQLVADGLVTKAKDGLLLHINIGD